MKGGGDEGLVVIILIQSNTNPFASDDYVMHVIKLSLNDDQTNFSLENMTQ